MLLILLFHFLFHLLFHFEIYIYWLLCQTSVQILNICFKYIIIDKIFEIFFNKAVTSTLSNGIPQILIDIVRKWKSNNMMISFHPRFQYAKAQFYWVEIWWIRRRISDLITVLTNNLFKTRINMNIDVIQYNNVLMNRKNVTLRKQLI